MYPNYVLMKRILLIFLVALFALPNAKGQNYRLEAGVLLGASNVLGDIGGKSLPRRDFVADLKIQATALSGGVYGRYALSPRLHAGLSVMYGSINGRDSLSTNPGRRQRNLSFRNRLLDIASFVDYEIYEQYNVGRSRRYRIDFATYVTLGVGVFFHNPEARIGKGGFESSDGTLRYNQGEWVKLQPLATEGVNYSTTGVAILLGAGFDFTIDRNFRVGFRTMLRSTNTDYLDDISGDYVDPSSFANTPEGELARELAYRGDEIGRPQTWQEGQKFQEGSNVRGNMDRDDDYFFINLTFAYVLKGKGGKYDRKFHSGYQRSKGTRKSIRRFNF